MWIVFIIICFICPCMHSSLQPTKVKYLRAKFMNAWICMNCVTHIKQMRNSHIHTLTEQSEFGETVFEHLLHWSSKHAMRIPGIEFELCSSFTVVIFNSIQCHTAYVVWWFAFHVPFFFFEANYKEHKESVYCATILTVWKKTIKHIWYCKKKQQIVDNIKRKFKV